MYLSDLIIIKGFEHDMYKKIWKTLDYTFLMAFFYCEKKGKVRHFIDEKKSKKKVSHVLYI